MDGVTLLLAATAISGLYMAWNIGANDVANAMGTSVGSGALTLRSALIVAALFEFVGALFAGGTVTRTISAGIVETEVIGGDPLVMAVSMTACLIAASPGCVTNLLFSGRRTCRLRPFRFPAGSGLSWSPMAATPSPAAGQPLTRSISCSVTRRAPMPPCAWTRTSCSGRPVTVMPRQPPLT